MDSISNIQPSLSPKGVNTVFSRITDSFGDEINSLLAAMVSEAVQNPPHLGTHVDVQI